MGHLEGLGLKEAQLNYTTPINPKHTNSETKTDLES